MNDRKQYSDMRPISPKQLLFLSLVIVTPACVNKKHSKSPDIRNDTMLGSFDTVVNPSSEKYRIDDSLKSQHQKDSFYAIRPVAVFTTDQRGDAYRKMTALLINTDGITQTPIAFSDTTIYRYDKDQNPISSSQICSSKRFVVKVYSPDVSGYAPQKLYINGRELRPGIEIDTSLSGSSYASDIQISTENCRLMRFGVKEYLFLSGYIGHCNGEGCSVVYYILFDPVLQKAMLLEQFRSEFLVGYDSKNKIPVFIDSGSDDACNYLFQCLLYSGKLYCYDHAGKIKRAVDKRNKQYDFTAYSRIGSDTVVVLERNFPDKNHAIHIAR